LAASAAGGPSAAITAALRPTRSAAMAGSRIELALRPAIFYGNVAALLIALFTQSPPECRHHRRCQA
jgi:hypothetical protein